MNISKLIMVMIIILVMITACTSKKNPVGFESELQPVEIEIDFTHFSDFISFEDSVGIYYNNSKLIVGNYASSKAVTLLRTINLPDSIISLDSEVIIKLEKTDSHNFDDISTDNLKFGILNSIWYENEASWFNSSDTTSWSSDIGFSEEDYELMEFYSIETEEDSIYLELPGDLLIDWIENDSLNYGIAILTDQDDTILEMISAEAESAFLKFSYTSATNDSTVEYSSKFTSDTFIYETDQEYERFAGELKISNIQPVKTFLKFDISDSVFINYENSGIENSDDYNRMVINKAELILPISYENNYPLLGTVAVVPHLVIADTIDYEDLTRPLLVDEDLEYFNDGTSSDSLAADDLEIDLKYIVQFITAGERENKGIVIESISEHKDFMNTSFTDTTSVDLKLKILYTPPFIEE